MVDFFLIRGDREATIRSSWILLWDESATRLTSRFVLLDSEAVCGN